MAADALRPGRGERRLGLWDLPGSLACQIGEHGNGPPDPPAGYTAPAGDHSTIRHVPSGYVADDDSSASTRQQEVMMQPFTFLPWTWRDPVLLGGYTPTADALPPPGNTDSAHADEQAHADLAGYSVEATDGGIGKIDEATYDVGSAHLVVDTGPWIFGRKVLLPAGTVQRIDHDDRTVYVDRTKDQIKDSPEYDKETFTTPEYRERVGGYYTGSYRDIPPVR
jgi:hypothetical protein